MTSKVSKEKVGYKLVRAKNGKYYSLTIYDPACVEYVVGKTSKPNTGCGPLCVFRSLREAKRHSFRGIVIMKVRYVPSEQQFVWAAPFEYSLCQLNDLFEGTVLADSVTPIERMVFE